MLSAAGHSAGMGMVAMLLVVAVVGGLIYSLVSGKRKRSDGGPERDRES